MSDVGENQKGPDEKYCSTCGAIIKQEAVICPKCGVPQAKEKIGLKEKTGSTFSKTFGIVIAIVLGIILLRMCVSCGDGIVW